MFPDRLLDRDIGPAQVFLAKGIVEFDRDADISADIFSAEAIQGSNEPEKEFRDLPAGKRVPVAEMTP